jgi:chorismate dehydratase
LHPEFLPFTDPTQAHRYTAVLLIGNPAITFRLAGSDHTIWDLGEAWKVRTELPFVYAVWALRRTADTTTLRAILQEAARRGLADREAVIRRTTEFTESFRRTYLTQHIQFHLGPREKEGITRFAALMERHGLGPIYPPRYLP